MKGEIRMTVQTSLSVLVIGIPEHLNQYTEEVKENHSFIEALAPLKTQHIISSDLGVIRDTALYMNHQWCRVVTVGLGNLKTRTTTDYLKLWGNVFQYLQKQSIEAIRLYLPTFLAKSIEPETIFNLMGLQQEQATYMFDSYKSDKSAPYSLHIQIEPERFNRFEAVIQEGRQLGRAINVARDLGNMPPNILTPAYFATLIEDHFKNTLVRVDIKDGTMIQQEGFGLLHAVGKGSSNPPRLITLEYNGNPNQRDQTIALVGKGITYDSGGYSIKSKNGMPTMKYDMCGAANVIGMIDAIQSLQLKVNVVGVIAAAENMIAPHAMKPDDVFTALSGETVEVPNTDAEGRLVLADASYYANQFQPSFIMDFATLTGAAIVALGDDKTAVFNKGVSTVQLQDILKHAQMFDEPTFELPITKTERANIKKSDVADLTNHVNADGKALFAAAFITHFSGQTPHLHFDIAGPATINKASFKGPKGATGVMISTIVNYLKQTYGISNVGF
ncbi:M17 family metallopeptidase [Staphylococcus hyicus]|uniref:M17 family metallopeptidase n=1 Tax=Staphylococcus hyicus TaxID=1284 RepID=A0ACD5FQQ0_STAHY